ncbi:MAG: hypothetical protein NWE86_07540 [Candidatus Bathyarchaeota archaeon]|nr:hypothetical protein [Candidatus Bathyarchaeota archaeon]
MRILFLSVLIILLIFATSLIPVNANEFTFSTSGDGSAGWTTEEVYRGSYSAKLNSGTGNGASAGKVSMSINWPLSSITSLSFWYRISSSSTAIPLAEMNAWPLYAREGVTFPFTADGYFSPYFIITIDVSGVTHYIISQQWAEQSAELDKWIEWKISDNALPFGGFDPTEALWHDELWTDDPVTGGAGSWPGGWEPLSFFKTTYAGSTIVSIGMAVGWWAVNEPQIVYVDSLTINGIGYDTDPNYVGGIYAPMNKLNILVPYVALIGLIGVFSTILVIRKWRKS